MKSICFSILTITLLLGCTDNPKEDQSVYRALVGETMGTSYSVKYAGTDDYQSSIDSLLIAINNSVSTYESNSLIAQLNSGGANSSIEMDVHFRTNYLTGLEINTTTSGAFNPAVMPLVNYYGFGFEKIEMTSIDTAKVALLLEMSGLDCFEVSDNSIIKKCAGAQLDFSAIAKGYGVDAIARQLESKGITNYLVEIGGETVARGVNERGTTWRVGVRKPSTNAAERRSVFTSFPLDGRAMATSGNYENYRKTEDGRVVAHTINPETGFPQALEEEVLSSTVFAPDCMTADAYATAFKVMGIQKSITLANALPEIECLLISADSTGEFSTSMSSGLEEMDTE